MSDKMLPFSFSRLLQQMIAEWDRHSSVFGYEEENFYLPEKLQLADFWNETTSTLVGPAAGPHTQLAQNLVVAYLSGGRFLELKTVQIMDELEIDKPCIDAADEGYNVEWSQELRLSQSFDEYLKAWFLIHFIFFLRHPEANLPRDFIFNMSVGYTLEGIQSRPMDRFIEQMKNAMLSPLFVRYRDELLDTLAQTDTVKILQKKFSLTEPQIHALPEKVRQIPAEISRSVTISTMHGCPPNEIAAIARYLMEEKRLHTYVKLNPTLLGYEDVRQILNRTGYDYIQLDPAAFEKDLQFTDALDLIRELLAFAAERDLNFGVKLSNTLGVHNRGEHLPGQEMYMSGRALFPLTIELAARLSAAFKERLPISYSGGASKHNIQQLLEAGIRPVTVATDLLKPGGYARLKAMAEKQPANPPGRPRPEAIAALSAAARQDKHYHKSFKPVRDIKGPTRLPLYDCASAPCKSACPIGQDIPQYLYWLEKGNPEEAIKTILDRNPLPFITGHICDHQCQFHCTRWDYDQTLGIRSAKKEAATLALSQYAEKYFKGISLRTRRPEVAIVGAGPAGLATAAFLARAGIRSAVFDREEKPGGTVQNLLPPFRLPREVIEKEIEFIKAHGCEFHLGKPVNLKKLQQDYRYVVLAIGAMLPRRLEIPGAENILYEATEFLRNFQQNRAKGLGRRVAVIGGGNSAMDAARAALRVKGVEKVYLIYRRTKAQMPADLEEFENALADGAIFRELLLPVAYQNGKLQCQKMKLGAKGPDGRESVEPLEGQFEWLDVESIIGAIGEKVDRPWLEQNDVFPMSDGSIFTSQPNVFIAGDARRGPATVVEAIADARLVAERICKEENTHLPNLSYLKEAPALQELKRRKSDFYHLPEETIQQEAVRCLHCDILCSKCVEVCPNRANVAIKTNSHKHFRDTYQIIHLDAACNECGNCETFCPHQGKPYRDKLTLFESEKDFLESSNYGVCFHEVNEKAVEISFRTESFQGRVSLPRLQMGLETRGALVFEPELLTLLEIILSEYPWLIPASAFKKETTA